MCWTREHVHATLEESSRTGSDPNRPGLFTWGDRFVTTNIVMDPTKPIILPAVNKSVPEVRRLNRAATEGFSDDARNEAEMLTSELVTNAIKHGSASDGSSSFSITMTLLGYVLRVEVVDEGLGDEPTLSHAPSTGTLAEGGWGLQLLSMFGAIWGHEKTADGGRLVWYELPLTKSKAAPASACDAPVRSLEKDPQEV